MRSVVRKRECKKEKGKCQDVSEEVDHNAQAAVAMASSQEQRATQQGRTGSEPCATDRAGYRAHTVRRVVSTAATVRAAAVRVLARARTGERGLSRSLTVRDVERLEVASVVEETPKGFGAAERALPATPKRVSNVTDRLEAEKLTPRQRARRRSSRRPSGPC